MPSLSLGRAAVAVIVGVLAAPAAISSASAQSASAPAVTSELAGDTLWQIDRATGERILVARFNTEVTDTARLRQGGHLVTGRTASGDGVVYRVSVGGVPEVLVRLPDGAVPTRIAYVSADRYLVTDDLAMASYHLDPRRGTLEPAPRPTAQARLLTE